MDGGAKQPPILTLDENALKDEARDLVRGTVEEAVNGVLDAQADELANAERYERTDERHATVCEACPQGVRRGLWIGNPYLDSFLEVEARIPELDRTHVA